jgi:hypothetical protein
MLAFGMVFLSACGDEDGGKKQEIPAALIKTLSINYDAGDYIETFEFTYDIDDRLTRVDFTDNFGADFYYTYDYSIANKLTETEVIEEGVEEYEKVFDLDSEGRIIKELRDDPADYNTFAYDVDGYMIEYTEVRDGVVDFKETATVTDDNIAVHTRYGDGSTISRTKTFTYLSSSTANNVSNLPQANLINNERKAVSGLYGKGSKKLLDFLELADVPNDDAEYRKNKNTYVFDPTTNQVVSIQRTGVDFGGIDTGLDELFTYTYYPIEE